ncbi:MAG: helix-turn-helix domain-containing protein [Candidatus Curtissbacteria bacterium]|nr:helix-turn-helix domain-containing protein [Candidatus Curtissbacteria bacterium]
MQEVLGRTLSEKRVKKGIPISRASRDLLIKKEQLEALETGDWESLPEPAFVRGFIKNYGDYLNLDTDHLLALYRREYDAAKHPSANLKRLKLKRFVITPTTTVTAASIFVVGLFVFYLLAQYFSIISSPKLDVFTPPADTTTAAPVIRIDGKTEPGATVAVNGDFAPVDQEGNFQYQYTLKDGQNIIEIIAAKHLSPKSKVTRIVRLSR